MVFADDRQTTKIKPRNKLDCTVHNEHEWVHWRKLNLRNGKNRPSVKIDPTKFSCYTVYLYSKSAWKVYDLICLSHAGCFYLLLSCCPKWPGKFFYSNEMFITSLVAAVHKVRVTANVSSILMLCNDQLLLKWHNLIMKTVDKFFDIYGTELHIYLCLCQISWFHTLTGQILPVSNCYWGSN